KSMEGYVAIEDLILDESIGDTKRYLWPTDALLLRKDKGVIQLVLDGYYKIPDPIMGLTKLSSLCRSTFYGSKAKLNFTDINQGFIFLAKDVVGKVVYVKSPTIEAGAYFETSLKFNPK